MTLNWVRDRGIMNKNIISLLLVGLMLVGYADAATISRLKSAEISNGNVINADDLEAEFDQLVNESNSKETRITNIESGNISISGNKTFSGTTTLSGVVNFSNNVNITGDLNLARATDPTVNNGDIWYNSTSNLLRARINGSTVTIGSAGVTPGVITGNRPVYATANTITLASGMVAADDTNTVNITTTTTETCALNTSGAGGLDTGSEAANTWYYPWLIRKSSDGTVDCLFSTSRTSPTMPSGYDQKRRLPLAVRNDGSSNIIPFVIGQGWPYSPYIQYATSHTFHNGTSFVNGPTQVYATAPTSTYAAITNLPNFIPPISTMAKLKTQAVSANASFALRNDTTNEEYFVAYGITGTSTTPGRTETVDVLTSTTQGMSIRLYNGTPTVYIDVIGFTVNE